MANDNISGPASLLYNVWESLLLARIILLLVL